MIWNWCIEWYVHLQYLLAWITFLMVLFRQLVVLGWGKRKNTWLITQKFDMRQGVFTFSILLKMWIFLSEYLAHSFLYVIAYFCNGMNDVKCDQSNASLRCWLCIRHWFVCMHSWMHATEKMETMHPAAKYT